MEAVDYGAALRAMVDKPYLGSAAHMAQSWQAYRVGAHPDVVEFEARLCRRFKRLGVPLYGCEVVRRPERQAMLYVKGLSARDSAHVHGLAVDIVHGTRWHNIDAKSWAVIGHLGREIALQAGLPMEWGGPRNPCHWEIANWQALSDGYPFGLGRLTPAAARQR